MAPGDLSCLHGAGGRLIETGSELSGSERGLLLPYRIRWSAPRRPDECGKRLPLDHRPVFPITLPLFVVPSRRAREAIGSRCAARPRTNESHLSPRPAHHRRDAGTAPARRAGVRGAGRDDAHGHGRLDHGRALFRRRFGRRRPRQSLLLRPGHLRHRRAHGARSGGGPGGRSQGRTRHRPGHATRPPYCRCPPRCSFSRPDQS